MPTIPYIAPDFSRQHAEAINAWNAEHPVGTPVLYDINSRLEGIKGDTTSPAFQLHDQPGGAVVRVNTHTFPVSLEDLEVQDLPHLWAEDFPVSYQRRMILAYPQIARMDNDEAWLASRDEKREAFDRILAAKNLRRTHEMFLADQAALSRPTTEEQ